MGKEITPEVVVKLMLSLKENWDRIKAAVKKILQTREDVERKKKKAEDADKQSAKLR